VKGHQPEKMSLEPCLKLTVADGWEQIPDNWSCDEELHLQCSVQLYGYDDKPRINPLTPTVARLGVSHQSFVIFDIQAL